MGIALKVNEMNEITKGTVFFQEGERTNYICIVLKGRVELYNQGSRIVMGNGSFLGIQDLYMGRYLSSYAALDDIVVYAFAAENNAILDRILASNKDYRGLLMYSMVRYINGVLKEQEEFKKQAVEGYEWICDCYQEYLKIASAAGAISAKQPMIEQLEPYESVSMLDVKKLGFFRESAGVPLEVMKSFYGCGSALTLFPVEQGAGVAAELTIENIEAVDYLEDLLGCLTDELNGGLFETLIRLAMALSQKESAKDAYIRISNRIDECMDLLNRLEELIVQKTGRTLTVDRGRLEQLYTALLTGDRPEDGETSAMLTTDDQLTELKNSLNQILAYAELDEQNAEQLRALIHSFEDLKDRNSTDDGVRKLKRGIASLFYTLYEATFLKAYQHTELPLAVDLFLNFGYLSEKLLEKEDICVLLGKLREPFTGDYGYCTVYTIREWLMAIYEGRREPSKNDLDMDYTDYVRSLRKQNQITDTKEKEMVSDKRAKLRFEIQNFFAINNRVVNGQVTSFVPVLHHDMMPPAPDHHFVSADRLLEMIEKVKKVDFGVFYRDILFTKPEVGIDKIYIMREIYPDIVLMPMVGSRVSMWQECASKRRDLPGRFALPVFLTDTLENAVVRLFGRFRWELCRFLQGGSWNNIKYHSLTSEYCDYLQFYRKNHELSEERKEKIKLQIQKGKNNTREIFVMDYEVWIKNESAGAMRLNKPVREMLATWCPFAADIRNRLAGQPIFEEAMARGNRERAKHAHEMEQRIRMITKENKGEVPEEVLATLEYYQNN